MKLLLGNLTSDSNPAHRRWHRLALFTLAAATLIIASVAVLDHTGRLSASLVLADARAIGELPMSAGFLSDIGVLIWWSAACVSAFAALALLTSDRRMAPSATDMDEASAQLAESSKYDRRFITSTARYLLTSACVTGVLALDDDLMLHERLFPRLFGVDQHTVYLMYVLGIVVWLVVFRHRLMGFLPGWLLLALMCFAGSVAFDILPEQWRAGALHAVLEDGLKWIGIVVWSSRLWCESLQCLIRARTPIKPSTST